MDCAAIQHRNGIFSAGADVHRRDADSYACTKIAARGIGGYFFSADGDNGCEAGAALPPRTSMAA